MFIKMVYKASWEYFNEIRIHVQPCVKVLVEKIYVEDGIGTVANYRDVKQIIGWNIVMMINLHLLIKLWIQIYRINGKFVFEL